VEFLRTNPVTGETVTRAAAATAADAVAAAEAAARAFPAWAALGPSERRTRLNRAADLLEARAVETAAVISAETGATGGWGHFNVHLAAGILREAAAMTTQVGGEVVPSDVPGNFAMALRQPAGVVLGIAPWNAPLILGVRAVAMPLACGNTVILKGSEVCPATHRLIASILIEAGMGDGVVNYICHEPRDAGAVVEAMIAHSAVRRINFTGSTRVGRLLALSAAKYLKPILLELGGKAPLVVLDDADLDAAVDATVFGAFAHSGQICMSTERVIVHEKIADAFARRLADRVLALPTGDPAKGDFVLGSVVGMATVDRVKRLVDAAVAQGAQLLCGGEARGTIMSGVVVDKVTPRMELFREESFGPQVSITRVKSDDEAVQLANDTEYGLSAAVFSRDIGRALGIARRIRRGSVTSTGPRCTMRRRCPSGAPRPRATGVSGARRRSMPSRSCAG
jgi:benzaldehyde dehydrogenase (NAD)